ncbi:MAG TPA: Xaa-Pro peptidase family protein [Acidimicrobiia bacterium]|nr:Xaa-Pro peptidase family protein [Acidimicrobiia bacterium]
MTYAGRIERVRSHMAALDVDTLLLSVGPDLPYLTGYEAMPLERLTMLVLPRAGDASLVVPRLEAPRVEPRPDLFTLVPWDETDDPIALVARLVGVTARRVAIGDHTWARFVLDLQRALASCSFIRASGVTAPVRMVKDAAEIAALTRAAHAVDGIARDMRDVRFSGRTELDVHRELVERMLAAGHERSNFAIVAAGEHAASPHHEPSGERTIAAGDIVLCDFGGTMHGYCSDITRMFHVGDPPVEVRDAYTVLAAAQQAGVQAATVGTRCESVDAAARSVISEAGWGEYFVHRVGHGIGTEAHEDPYMVAGNEQLLAPGYAFSVEPGIYFPGRFGMRLEDIVVATVDGPLRLNEAPRDIAIVA